MKKCPKCNKEISEHARQCPYCGNYVSGKYQPIQKSNNRKAGIGYGTLALILILLPMLISYFISSPLGNNNYKPKEVATLGTVEKVSKEEEKVKYAFESLEDFSKMIDGGDKYVKKIEAFEKQMQTIFDKYAKPSMDPTYQILVARSNNIFFYLTYDIVIDDNQTMVIECEYDITGRSNDVKINYQVKNFKDFETMKIHPDSYPMYREMIALVNGDNELALFQETGDAFNALETSFKERDGKIGNYGLGVTKEKKDDTSSMRVTSKQEGYRLKCIYQTKFKNNLY